MRRDDLLELLCTLFPAFRSYWLADNNYFRNVDDYTSHGICACFSHFYSAFLGQSDDADISRLFASIESVIADDKEDVDATANAVATCFLENIAGTVSGERAKKFMGEASRRYFDSLGFH